MKTISQLIRNDADHIGISLMEADPNGGHMQPAKTIPFQLVDPGGGVIHTDMMPWSYVQPRIVIWKGENFVLLSNDVGPGPGTADHPHQYIRAGKPYNI